MIRILPGILLTSSLLWAKVPVVPVSLPPKGWQVALNHAFSIAKEGNVKKADFQSFHNPSLPPVQLIGVWLVDSRGDDKFKERKKEIESYKKLSRKQIQRLLEAASLDSHKLDTTDGLLFSAEGELLFVGPPEKAWSKLEVPRGWVSLSSPAVTCQWWKTFGPKSKPIIVLGDIKVGDERELSKTNYDVVRSYQNRSEFNPHLPHCVNWELHEDAMQAFGWFINHPLHRPVQSLKFFKKSEQIFLTRVVFPDGSAHWLHLDFKTNPRDPVEVQVPEDQIELKGEDGLIYEKEGYGLILALE